MKSGGVGSWKAVPDYDPYKVAGDFNDDGIEDIAVIVLDSKKTHDSFSLVVFNGPFGGQSEPALFATGLDMKHRGLFYGPPRPKPFRLVFGRFEAEGVALVPNGKTYRLK